MTDSPATLGPGKQRLLIKNPVYSFWRMAYIRGLNFLHQYHLLCQSALLDAGLWLPLLLVLYIILRLGTVTVNSYDINLLISILNETEILYGFLDDLQRNALFLIKFSLG